MQIKHRPHQSPRGAEKGGKDVREGGSSLRLLTAGAKSAFVSAHKRRIKSERERESEGVGIVQPNMIQLPICMFATIKCECLCVCVGTCEWE